MNKEDWLWRTNYKTKRVQIAENISQEEMNALMDQFLAEVTQFEEDLKEKLKK